MNEITSARQPGRQVRPEGGHPVARALSWVLGAVAVALTGLFAWAGIDTIVSWSSYVGGERSTVLFIMGFLALLSVLAWLGTRIAFVASRR